MFNSTNPFRINGYVYEGLWTNHNASPFWRWTWTLSDSKALFGLACVTILVAFAQTRAWVLLCFAVYQRTKSPQLPDPKNADYRQHISQGVAIAEFLPYSKRAIKRALHRTQQRQSIQLDHEESLDAEECPAISPLFGLMALLNIVFFLLMGVLIPWALTDGSLETPIVKSKATETCLEAKRAEKLPHLFANLPQTDVIFQQCQNRLYDDCISQDHFVQPKIHKERTRSCPFPGDICRNDTMPIEMTHSNIGAYDVGINTHTKITMNHRLICAPILLDSFYVFSYGNSTSTQPLNASITILDSSLPMLKGKALYNGYATPLFTLNGPHFASQENSGLRMADFGGPSSLTILPHVFNPFDSEMQHPDLRTNDSMPFLVIYRAGTSGHIRPSDDPLFSAHNPCTLRGSVCNHTSYCADQEVTALGCCEKFQFCMGGFGCTDWGEGSSAAYKLLDDPLIRSDEDIRGDILTLYRMMPAMTSVHRYLGVRSAFFQPMIPLVTRDSSPFDAVESSEPWATEVETWFMKGIVDAIQFARYGARFPLDEESEKFDMEFRRKYSLCGRILFCHGSYTNINWIGLWVTTGALVLICLISYFVKTIDRTILKWQHIIAKVVNLARFLRLTLKDGTLASRGNSVVFQWWQSFHKSPFSYHWPSSGPQMASTGNETEMNDIETASVSLNIADGAVDSGLEDVDNVI